MIKIGTITLYPDLAQGSEEWHLMRSRSIGSSEFSTAAASGRNGKESKTRNTLIEVKVVTEATGIVQQGFTNAWMNRGTRIEPQAAEWMEVELRRIYAQAGINLIGLATVGIVRNDLYAGLHSSPDRLIDAGIWPMPAAEIKCPSPLVHFEYLSDWVKYGAGWHPTKYHWQIKVHRVICGGGCWFCSFDPDCDAQVLSWIPPATETEKQEVFEVLDRWRKDLATKKQDIDRLLDRIKEDEKKKEVETAALLEAAKKQLLEVAI